MRRSASVFAGAAAALMVLRLLAWSWARPAEGLFDGDLEAQRALSRSVDRWVTEELDRGDFSTGSARYDGEWLFMSRMMAVIGYAQVAAAHPELAEETRPKTDTCLAELMRAGAFDEEAWGRSAWDDLGSERPHVGYLGYLALALAAAETVHPNSPEVARLPEIIAHLVPLYEASPIGLLETYPGEIYPIDNTSFFGALGLHDRTTGRDHAAFLHARADDLRTRFRDPATGLLTQSVAPDGTAVDGPRASGTGLASYFLSFCDRRLSGELYAALQDGYLHQTLGFGTTSEYPPGRVGVGDVDSGPVIFGQGVSATGFTLALARIHGDRETFVATWATASAVGGPVFAEGAQHFALGGPLGDSLLFALATAGPLAEGAPR
ncbi:MAG: hypothetical protein AB8I08_18965 [Sandaracinaceae bacterium]